MTTCSFLQQWRLSQRLGDARRSVYRLNYTVSWSFGFLKNSNTEFHSSCTNLYLQTFVALGVLYFIYF